MNTKILRPMSLFAAMFALAGCTATGPRPTAPEAVIVAAPEAAFRVDLAARETRRYVQVRTGTRLPLVPALPATGDAIVLTLKGSPLLAAAADDATVRAAAALGAEQYLLKTLVRGGRRVLVVAGGDDAGVLYGAYRLAEHLGVRFYLHGDVVPDARVSFRVPDLDETGRPLFATRGIQPFHDFPEGPDWWNRDDYLAYGSQLAKMRMNFLGLHCYPEGGVGPEPLVWIGVPGDLDATGKATFSYPSRWADTRRPGPWGYAAMRTSEFCGGADRLFAGDDFGPDVHGDLFASNGAPPEVCNEVFNRTSAQMAQVFAHTRALGVKTCIGTETPLTVPKLVRERLAAQGKDPKDPAVLRELYTGMFKRIAQTYPVDYYWLWTPEDWTWRGNTPEQFKATVDDMQAALDALKGLGNPFTFATSGWVLGPDEDRAALDRFLPRECPISCINRQVGHAPVEPGFAAISNRPTWAIPWMENDPNLVAPQPWVARMRYDAFDAKRYGCTGLLGIHWRAKQMAQNVAALAAAAWDQSWVPAGFAPPAIPPPQPEKDGAQGGQLASFSAPVENTEEDPLYQTVRYSMKAYSLKVPNGTYTVTLKLNEPHYDEAGKRVFGAKVQGSNIVEKLDLFARFGKNRAYDVAVANVVVKNGKLQIDFVRVVENPCIAGIVVEGMTDAQNQVPGAPFAKRINCGGPAWRNYEADQEESKTELAGRDRAMPAEDFYTDYARANFGDAVATGAARLLASIDGVKLPEPSTWIQGPGGIKANRTPWEEVRKSYAFVDDLAALRAQVRGPGNLERFDYWLNTYRCMAAMAEAGCLRGSLDAILERAKKAADATAKQAAAREALPVREQLARTWERMISWQVAACDTPGELGTLANLEQHNRRSMKFVTGHDEELAKLLGAPLPAACELRRVYAGPAHIVVPTVRTQVARGEPLILRILAVGPDTPTEVSACVRPMSGGHFQTIAAKPLGRGVFVAKVPGQSDDFEYYVSARIGPGAPVFWPATGADLAQSVIVTKK